MAKKVKEVINKDNSLQYVCQRCGKDLGTAQKIKGTIYHEPNGGWYCESCYKKKEKL